MKATFTLGRVAGIAIGVHYTWLIAFALITWTLAAGFFPEFSRDWPPATYWATGFVAALLLFVSVLAHELAHSLVARSRGLPVQGITLFIFGGVSNLGSEAGKAWDEFLIAVVGPLLSLALAALFGLWWVAVSGQKGPLAATVAYLALVNGMLGAFNLLPGFPLDGGRVLRAILWGATKSYWKATTWAAAAGQGVAFLLIAWGVWQFLAGNVLGGLWIAFIGWFVHSAADSSRREAQIQRLFRDVTVQQVMEPQPETVAPTTSVDELLHHHFLQRSRRAMPVHDGERLLGIVTLSDVKGLAPALWPATQVADIMAREPLYTVPPEATVSEALKLLAVHNINQLLVVQQERLVGVLSRASIIQYLQVVAELGVEEALSRRGPEPKARAAG